MNFGVAQRQEALSRANVTLVYQMAKRRIYDREGHAHFVTFSCYKRRRLLDHDQAKRIVLGVMRQQLKRLDGTCIGFVIMPNHVHAIVGFPVDACLSEFMKQWKRTSSARIKRLLSVVLEEYAARTRAKEAVW